MRALFLGLTGANLVVLCITFAFGLGAVTREGQPSGVYNTHLLLGFLAGLWATLTHVVVFTYFMATTKWLGAASDKAGVGVDRFSVGALSRKRRAFFVAMAAVVLTMLNLFAGAGADPTMQNRLWPGEVHLTAAAIAIGVNLLAAIGEWRLIVAQGDAVGEAAALLNPDGDSRPTQA